MLTKLIERVETGDPRFSSYLPAEHERHWPLFYRAFEGSLDAAKALQDALLPGWSLLIHGGHHGTQDFGAQIQRVQRAGGRITHTGRGATAARAWLLAILRALNNE